MRILVERSALVDGLTAVNARACGKMKIPILACVRIDAAQSRLNILAHWLDACCSFEISAEVQEPGAAVVDAIKLLGLVSNFANGSQVAIAMTGNKIEIRSGRARYRLPSLPLGDFPDPLSHDEDATEFTLSPKEFAALLTAPEVAMGDDINRRCFTGIHLHRIDSCIASCATNAAILVRVRSKAEVPPFPAIIIPRERISDLRAHLDKDDVDIECGARLLSVRVGMRTYTTKLVDAEFPDYKRVIPPDNGTEIFVVRKEMLAALQRLCVLLGNHDAVTLKWDAGAPSIAIIPHRRPDGAEEFVESSGGEIGAGDFTTPASRLAALLSALPYDEVKIIYTPDPNKPLRIEGANDDSILQLTMPMDFGKSAAKAEAA